MDKLESCLSVFLISLCYVNLTNDEKTLSCPTCFCSNLNLWSGPQRYHREYLSNASELASFVG